jgi:hypothetical protein
MNRKIIPIAAVVLLLVGALVAAVAQPEAGRSDCPGKIVCPLTGEEVCRDHCPLSADVVNATQGPREKASTPASQTTGCCSDQVGPTTCCRPAKSS